jgi:hypothetical protein
MAFVDFVAFSVVFSVRFLFLFFVLILFVFFLSSSSSWATGVVSPRDYS